MRRYAFYFDGSRCTGCKTCEFACKDYHDLDVGTAFRRVYEVTTGETVRADDGTFATTCASYPVSLACNHCDDPACARVCPTRAMGKDPASGLVVVDEGRCVGCGYCAMACPYGAPRVDRDRGCSVKCDGCAERVAAGSRPVCVDACPARALDFGTAGALRARGSQASVAPLPPPGLTRPNLYVRPAAAARPSGDAEARVANPLEVI
ncbi:4Fe-4S dicluster domain-containing protein [Adlercreutzia faecimuris]|uniref:4Fe-4S dicluster domain-containing protein n=1 Tax=Adlercreutzia faecimuris TaxID=2897341 RepID=A0ABS9WI65_9ACTN|nr:4Fe-4S dicluster domain-containing protein [Adlercreutzia sp. JBNU-10]MCI2242541.1 4Fe-4S dicluster domain-containing protein [Adlercreutzia sp. JBNU-10]